MYAEALITKILHRAAKNNLTEETRLFDPPPQFGDSPTLPTIRSSTTPVKEPENPQTAGELLSNFSELFNIPGCSFIQMN